MRSSSPTKLDDRPRVNHILFKGKSEAEFYASNAINLILCLKIPKGGATWNSGSVPDFAVYAWALPGEENAFSLLQ